MGAGRPPTVRKRGGAQLIPRPPGARPGRPSPWAHLDAAQRRLDLTRVRRALVGAAPAAPALAQPGVPASAVLVALFEEAGTSSSSVVLTRRAAHLRNHRGEVSFPGGRQDPGEDLVRTALREAEEEIALDSATVEVVAELDHLSTVISPRAIVPFVGLLPGRPDLVANADEVERILLVPLDELLSEDVFREERWPRGGVDRAMWFYELEGDTVWGATARVLTLFLARLLGAEVPPEDVRRW